MWTPLEYYLKFAPGSEHMNMQLHLGKHIYPQEYKVLNKVTSKSPSLGGIVHLRVLSQATLEGRYYTNVKSSWKVSYTFLCA